MKKFITPELKREILHYKSIRESLRFHQTQTKQWLRRSTDTRQQLYDHMKQAGFAYQSIRKTIAEVKQ